MRLGGTAQEAEQKAYYEPFEKATGIKVRVFPASSAKIKPMVDTGNVEWDVIHTGRTTVARLMKTGDYFERIDYSLIDDGVPKEHRLEYGVEMQIWAQVMAYRTDAFKGAAPASWADFWNTDKIPGDRAVFGIGDVSPEMEFALMAAGVPADKIDPIDVDKALVSYDKIKKNVVNWWQTGAQPTQMLSDREVVMTTVWNARMLTLQEQGVPAAIYWNQGMLNADA